MYVEEKRRGRQKAGDVCRGEGEKEAESALKYLRDDASDPICVLANGDYHGYLGDNMR